MGIAKARGGNGSRGVADAAPNSKEKSRSSSWKKRLFGVKSGPPISKVFTTGEISAVLGCFGIVAAAGYLHWIEANPVAVFAMTGSAHLSNWLKNLLLKMFNARDLGLAEFLLGL